MNANSGCVASSAFASSMEALQQPTIRIIAIIAEGVPEADAKKLIAYARANNKVFDTPSSHSPWILTHSMFPPLVSLCHWFVSTMCNMN